MLVDLATLRSAAQARGISADRINPTVPVDLVVDHSVQVDSFGTSKSLLINLDREYDRNSERYRFLQWSHGSFRNLRIVPPGNGIVHQINLEFLAQVVRQQPNNGSTDLIPDTLIGTDSHTTMVNGLGVLGWGVGGIEAEAVMLGEPYFLSRPRIVGVELIGRLPEGSTATDIVLTVTRELRRKGVVDKFVEFCGPALRHLSVPDRATISNMCPEYGATAALFPVDEATLAYLSGTGRDPELVRRVAEYARWQGLWGAKEARSIDFDETLTIDLGSIVPTISGPRNPEQSVPLSAAPAQFREARDAYRGSHPSGVANSTASHPYPSDDPVHPYDGGIDHAPDPESSSGRTEGVRDGSVVIAAITSCTNTSNPSVMIGAGLIARRARELGLRVPPYVKTSLAPGSKVVTEYLKSADLLQPLEELGFSVVGYGCTTCIGNSGPLPPGVERSVTEQDAYVASVLSGNRNFEARIHNLVRANYLMSPMLVVVYALAGSMEVDLSQDPVSHDAKGNPVYLKDLWPSSVEIQRLVDANLSPKVFREKYRTVEKGDVHWDSLEAPSGNLYPWRSDSTYLREAPYLGLPPPWLPRSGVLAEGARALAVFGDQISTDHISPAGEIPEDTPAGQYLRSKGVPVSEFNTYGSRRGDHEVMVRGTFANVRIRNRMVAPKEGGFTKHLPTGELDTIYSVAARYRAANVPQLVLAGKNYGQGSSRDWAAKGPRLLGAGAVLAESYERIHRSNLVAMGVLPLEFESGKGLTELGLTGSETFRLRLPQAPELAPGCTIDVECTGGGGSESRFSVRCRIDSSTDLEYYRAGGVLPFVLNERFAR